MIPAVHHEPTRKEGLGLPITHTTSTNQNVTNNILYKMPKQWLFIKNLPELRVRGCQSPTQLPSIRMSQITFYTKCPNNGCHATGARDWWKKEQKNFKINNGACSLMTWETSCSHNSYESNYIHLHAEISLCSVKTVQHSGQIQSLWDHNYGRWGLRVQHGILYETACCGMI